MQTLTPTALNNPQIVRAWCMYDWANSVYSLVITSAIFPVYYKAVAKVGESSIVTFAGFQIENSVLYSYALSVSFLIVALILPLLSGMADYRGQKKRFMQVFVLLGSLACMGLYFFKDVTDLSWGIACSMFASIGYSGSLVFYDAFLPEIVTPDQYDRTSARGYSMGYFGSVILMVICLAMILSPATFWFDTSGDASRFSFLLTGIWWFGFALIPITILKDNPNPNRKIENAWTKGYAEIKKVWQSLKENPVLKRYLFAYFFFNMGVQTVMYLATLFGTDVLHLEDAKLIGTVLIIQLVGAVGASYFARLSKKRGNKIALQIMITIWILICITAYLVTNEYQFYALAFVVGLVMGGIQALSRATYSKLIPASTADHASYFSFYDVTFNLSVVFGTFSFGLINHITGSMRNSALALGVFFIIGIILLQSVKAKAIESPQ